MEVEKQCILVLIGATPEGRKELIGFQTGFRESAQSWTELLTDLKSRGLAVAPELAIGEGEFLENPTDRLYSIGGSEIELDVQLPSIDGTGRTRQIDVPVQRRLRMIHEPLQ